MSGICLVVDTSYVFYVWNNEVDQDSWGVYEGVVNYALVLEFGVLSVHWINNFFKTPKSVRYFVWVSIYCPRHWGYRDMGNGGLGDKGIWGWWNLYSVAYHEISGMKELGIWWVAGLVDFGIGGLEDWGLGELEKTGFGGFSFIIMVYILFSWFSMIFW